jgi:hypothetical protein
MMDATAALTWKFLVAPYIVSCLGFNMVMDIPGTLLRIYVGLTERQVTVTVRRCDITMLDVACLIRRQLRPEFDDVDIKFVSGIGARSFEMSLVVTEAILEELRANGLRAVMLPAWKVKVVTPKFSSFDCDCHGTGVVHSNVLREFEPEFRCYGQNILININHPVNPPLRRGQTTTFEELLKEHEITNEGNMSSADLLELMTKSREEVLWSCCGCGKLAVTGWWGCCPHDDAESRWHMSNTRNLWCWKCFPAFGVGRRQYC